MAIVRLEIHPPAERTPQAINKDRRCLGISERRDRTGESEPKERKRALQASYTEQIIMKYTFFCFQYGMFENSLSKAIFDSPWI